jgi:hypothetical protein
MATAALRSCGGRGRNLTDIAALHGGLFRDPPHASCRSRPQNPRLGERLRRSVLPALGQDLPLASFQMPEQTGSVGRRDAVGRRVI